MADENKELSELSFEEALATLQETVGQLESGEQSLQQSLALYEKGQALVRYCQEKLDSAALRIEQLTEDGEIIVME